MVDDICWEWEQRCSTDQCSILLELDNISEIYQKDVEKEFFINRATASKMLSLMEEKHLIRRTEATEDARLKRIELLPQGYELHELCISIRSQMESKLTKDISKEDLRLFKTICKQMIANIEE